MAVALMCCSGMYARGDVWADSLRAEVDSIVTKTYYTTVTKKQQVAVKTGKRKKKTVYKTVTTTATVKRSFSIACCVFDLTTKQMLYSYNPTIPMKPASTQKLFTAATFLTMQGKKYTFDTSITCDKKVAKDSVGRKYLDGDLYLTTCCDPTLSRDEAQKLAQMVEALGYDSISGRVVMCQTARSAYTKKSNEAFVKMVAQALKQDSIRFPSDVNWAVENSTASGRYVVARHSTAFHPILVRMLKRSNNEYAEYILMNAVNDNSSWSYAACRNKVLELTNGLCNYYHSKDSVYDQRDSYYSLEDASGLSHDNRTMAIAEIDLLRYIHGKHDIYNTIYPMLPIAGVDGTLSKRMKDSPAYNNVHAKTGTLNGVSTLAGYTRASNGHLLAFSILINNCADNRFAHDVQDDICIAISR